MPEEQYEISLGQEQLWTAEPHGPTGRIQPLLTLHGPVDSAQVQAALRSVVARHELLRTTFIREPGTRMPVQEIHPALEPNWRELDLRAAAPEEGQTRLAEALADERRAPIDFIHGPVVRALFAIHGEAEHVLALTLSELHADRASVRGLASDLLHYLGAGDEPLDEPLQYADFAAWQRDLATADDDAARAARRWLAERNGASPGLPFTTMVSPASATEAVSVELSDGTLSALLAETQRADVTDDLFALATWYVLLARATGQEDVVVGVCGPLSESPDLDGAIGPFGWVLPLRAEVGPDTSFAGLLDSLAAERRSLAEHEAYASGELGDGLTTGFAAVESCQLGNGDLRISVDAVAVHSPQWPLWLEWDGSHAPASARIHFDPEALSRQRAEQLARWFARLLDAFARAPHAPVAQPHLLVGAEVDAVIRDFNDTGETAPAVRVHELIADQAARHPDRAAVTDGRESLSFGELDRRSNQLAHRLKAAGVGVGSTVGLCTDRSPDMVVGLLGILKAGAAYVPLHPEHPAVRLKAQLEVAGAQALVTQAPLLAALPEVAAATMCLDRDRTELDSLPSTPPLPDEGTPDDLAYVIFTSGSTGAPKGVAVTHRSLAGYAIEIGRRLGAIDEPVSFGLVTSIATDLGNTSVFGALASGGQLVLVDAVAAADPFQLAERLAATPVDVLKITPSHLRALLSGSEQPTLPRRWLVIGGEVLSWDLAAAVGRVSDTAIMNHYGPTEATVGCCATPVTDELRRYEPASVPIGRPLSGAACYILNGALRPVPVGVPGRLFVGGDGVARGYVGEVELTAERFLPDPFASLRLGGENADARMYDSGDLARWLPDGTIEFLGRVDDQVKIRGFRVEPGEIEAVLRAHVCVSEAIVTVGAEPAGEPRLIAYFTASAPVSLAELRGHLRERLPEHMVPATYVEINAVPRTASGKVDKRALPQPSTAASSPQGRPYVAPRTSTEESVGAIWQEMLGVERVGVADDFFELGGHSLLGAGVVAQLRSEFGVELPLHALFVSPTVEALAHRIDELLLAGRVADLAVGSGDRAGGDV
jgi:amino acid adenylation domain-containing protein